MHGGGGCSLERPGAGALGRCDWRESLRPQEARPPRLGHLGPAKHDDVRGGLVDTVEDGQVHAAVGLGGHAGGGEDQGGAGYQPEDGAGHVGLRQRVREGFEVGAGRGGKEMA